ncbi:phage baseplate assembly protein V [Pseudoruegeria aquimaris]|uniref:phage baseplate assembly protein V n=1 Tax=Pseudoruegeria aquimaris TaxID=393663 RepID=UPI0015940ABA|nr:phage baseplate assembly protein V [Pseudoruegeria aquimaris]
MTEIDPATAKGRVQFPDHDNVQSYWLQVLQGRTRTDRTYWMPAVGEHVVVIMDQGEEAGVIAGAIYSAADAPPSSDPNVHTIVYGDGASLTYDKGGQTFTLSVGGTTVEISPAGVAITSPSLTHNGTNVGDTHIHPESIGVVTGPPQ